MHRSLSISLSRVISFWCYESKVQPLSDTLSTMMCLYLPYHWGIKLWTPHVFTGIILKNEVHVPQSMRYCHCLWVKCNSHSGLPSGSSLPRWNTSPDTGSTHQVSVSDLCTTAYSPVYEKSITCHCRAMCINTDTQESISQSLDKIFDYICICSLIQHAKKKHEILKHNLPIHRADPERSNMQNWKPIGMKFRYNLGLKCLFLDHLRALSCSLASFESIMDPILGYLYPPPSHPDILPQLKKKEKPRFSHSSCAF